MPTTDEDLLDEELLETEPIPAPRGRLLGGLPGLPISRPKWSTTGDAPTSTTTTEAPPIRPPMTASPGPDSTGSSPGSTEHVDPRDFREALRAGVDIAFVVAGQAVGSIAARRTGEARDANRWKPTPAERRRVADPAHRIARRHMTNSVEAMDTIDVCLMAAAVGAYISRAGFDLDELEELGDE